MVSPVGVAEAEGTVEVAWLILAFDAGDAVNEGV